MYEREEESVRMCVRRCVRNFERREENNAYSRRTVICLFYTQHTLIRNNTYIHIYIHAYTHTHTLVQKEKKREKMCVRYCGEYARSPLLLYYYRVTPYVCLYYRGVHSNRWSFWSYLRVMKKETVW